MLIGEIARRSGLSKDGIRHYETLGLIHSKPVQAGSRTYRDYDDTTYERLSIIALAKRLHFSLKELVTPLDRLMSDDISREERSQIMAQKMVEIDQRIQALQEARAELAVLVETPEKPYADARLKALGLWVE